MFPQRVLEHLDVMDLVRGSRSATGPLQRVRLHSAYRIRSPLSSIHGQTGRVTYTTGHGRSGCPNRLEGWPAEEDRK